MNLLKPLIIFCLLPFFGCSSSNDNTVVTVADPTDLHTYSFWTDESIAGVEARMDITYANSVKELERIFAIENKTYMNFVRPYMEISTAIDVYINTYNFMHSITPDNKFIAIFNKYNLLSANLRVILSKYEERRKQAASAIYKSEKLDPVQVNILRKLGGVNNETSMPPEKQARVIEIDREINDLMNQFDENLQPLASARSLIITDEKLLGNMPKHMKMKFSAVPSNDTERALTAPSWVFGAYDESYNSFMEYVPDRELRKQMYVLSKLDDNKPIITKILDLRHERAVIYGFANYAEYRNKTELSAPSVANVKEVLEYNLAEAVKWLAAQQNNMQAMARLDGVETIEPYDYDYYMRAALPPLDKNFERYFEQWATLDGIFKYLGEMYGIKFEEQPVKLWNNDARKYRVTRTNGELVATVFADYNHTPQKTDGAAFTNLLMRKYLNDYNIRVYPVVVLLMNLPVIKQGEPTTLPYLHAVSIPMHEFGHMLHAILPEYNEYTISGFNSFPSDFVEYPSNLHEHLSFISAKFLQDISKSVDNGTKISDEFLRQHMQYQKYEAAKSLIERSFGGLLDLEIHSGPNTYDNANAILENLNIKYGQSFSSRFSLTSFYHLFAGSYAGSYYSYVWGRLYAADSLLYMRDASGKFGLNAQKFNDFKTKLLNRAGTKPFEELYKDFRGDGFDKEALLKMIKEK